MTELNRIRKIEERSLNAWPSLQEILYDGWVLRFAEGFTRRSNSINPIYQGSQGVFEKTLACEDMYRQRDLSPVFKISPLVHPEDLDEILEGRGYEKEGTTSVQSLNLNTFQEPTNSRTEIVENVSMAWFEDYAGLQNMDPHDKKCFGLILEQTAAKICYLTLQENGKTVSAGLAILEGDHVGLFGLITRSDLRGKGLGRQMVVDALCHARKRGASLAYLQVLMKNDPALRLYSKLGFQECYHYWYRTKENWFYCFVESIGHRLILN
jgi:ribosomal protein S18 acetylase RimI-like enzyme